MPLCSMIAERFPVSYPTGSGASQSLFGELGKHQEEVERPRSRLALASQAAASRLPNPHSFRRGAAGTLRHTSDRRKPLESAVPQSDQKRVLAIASGGGHWQQLMRLRPAFEKQSATYVTTNAAYSVDVPGGEVFVVTAANRNHPMNLIQTAVQKRWHEPSSGCGMTRRLP